MLPHSMTWYYIATCPARSVWSAGLLYLGAATPNSDVSRRTAKGSWPLALLGYAGARVMVDDWREEQRAVVAAPSPANLPINRL